MPKKNIWWEPNNLLKHEKFVRENFISMKTHGQYGEFAVYRAILQNSDPQEVNLGAHNVYQKKN